MKNICFSPGVHIAEAARLLVESAPARGDFNGITLTAEEGMSPEAIVDEYQALSERRHREWLQSPEGRKESRRREMEVQNLQAKADRLMAHLTSLDFSNVAALLDWLCEMEEPRDRMGVGVDVPLIISTFTTHGYQPNVNCGAEFNESDPDNFARWIIGQAIKEPYYPGVRRFAGEWRKKFMTARKADAS
jgi:hypothetical protein